MIRHQEVTEYLSREWELISGAPVTFVIGVLVVGLIIGVLTGLIIWKSEGRAARSKIDRLREIKVVEDDILDHVRAKHALEVDARKEIEAELLRLQSAVQHVHQNDISSDQLILDATAATIRAAEILKRSQDEFESKAHSWDELRSSMHHKASHDH